MELNTPNIYGGQDPRDLPAYTIAEAARYLRIASATLRSWVAGRPYPRGKEVAFFEPIIKRPDSLNAQLSFRNLVEAHVLRALRTEHGVSIRAVRTALLVAERTYEIRHLLLSPELRTEAGNLFLDKYGELVNLSKSGQLAIKKILEVYLKRVEWDQESLPLRLFPFLRRDYVDSPKVIVIDPYISFGRPVIRSKGIATATIAGRIDVGESVEDLAKDYDLQSSEVEEAVIYERAA
jgi:uncharacterized protein (DUF433 family)